LAPLALVAAVLWPAAAPSSFAQGAAPGTEYVTFWRGDLRVFAVRDRTEVTLIDINSGLPLNPGNWLGNFATNPFVLDNPGDSFEADSRGLTHRVRVVARRSGGPSEDKPVVVWTGDLGPTLIHPVSIPADQNAWMSYIPDVQRQDAQAGSELGRDFLGFSSRDMWVIASRAGGPVRVQVEDLATNTDTDSDDSFVLDASSPYLVHQDAEIEVYNYGGFEDDTIRLTSDTETTVLVGVHSPAFPDWTATPPSYAAGEGGRELGTLFYTFASRWLAILPVFDNTTVTVTDLSDGDDDDSFVLANGDRLNPNFDMYLADPLGRSNQPAAPRTAGPGVSFHFPPGGRIDDDLIKVESDRPVLVHVGPSSSDTLEFADVAYSVPTGPTQQLIYAYAQNGGAEDFQLFSFQPDNVVRITSLTHTQGFGTNTNHDHLLPVPTPFIGGNATYGDYYWSNPVWAGEMLRIESDFPVQVMGGDYDSPSFGAFIPFTLITETRDPVADAGPDEIVCPGDEITLDGSGSFDADFVMGAQAPSWTWDLDVSVDSDGDTVPDNDVDAVGPVVMMVVPAGAVTVKLTFTDDDGEVATDLKVVTGGDLTPPVLNCPSSVRAETMDFGTGFAAVLASVSDNCDPDPIVTNDRTAGGLDASDDYPCGFTLVTFTAVDDFGNETECTTRVEILPFGTGGVVGAALRVRKGGPAGEPLLDWSLAGLDPATRFAVTRDEGWPPDGLAVAPGAGDLLVTDWTEPDDAAPLIYYDVRTVVCDGDLSPD
jgi:hypothetical protein